MELENIKDIINLFDIDKNSKFMKYSGNWSFNENNINNILFNKLVDYNLLKFDSYVMSHKCVTIWKFNSDFKERLNLIKEFFIGVLVELLDENFKSLQEFIKYISNNTQYKVITSEQYPKISYWSEKLRQITANKCFIFYKNDKHLFNFNYYMYYNIKGKNKIYNRFKNDYKIIFKE